MGVGVSITPFVWGLRDIEIESGDVPMFLEATMSRSS